MSKEIAVAGPDARSSDGIDQEWAEDGAGKRSVGQGGDPQTVGEQNSADDNGDVVEQRPESRKQEQAARKQHRGHDAADVEEDLRRQQDAGEVNAEIELIGVETAEQVALDLRSEDFGEDGADPQHDRHHGDDDGEGLLRVLFFVLREEAGVDGNEGDGGGAAGDNVVQPVGNGETGDVGIGLRAGAEGPGDVGLADVSDDARRHDGRHQQQRGRKGAVLVRRPEMAEETVHSRRFRRKTQIEVIRTKELPQIYAEERRCFFSLANTRRLSFGVGPKFEPQICAEKRRLVLFHQRSSAKSAAIIGACFCGGHFARRFLLRCAAKACMCGTRTASDIWIFPDRRR